MTCSFTLIYIFVQDFSDKGELILIKQAKYPFSKGFTKMESSKFPYFAITASVFYWDGLFSFFGTYHRNFRNYYRFYWFG